MSEHYTEDALIRLLTEEGETAHDHHLSECASCRTRLASYEQFSSALRDASVWTSFQVSEPAPHRIASLRALENRLADESAQVESKHGLADAGDDHPSVGLVNALIKHAQKRIDTAPGEAVTLTRAATQIADQLDADAYEAETVLHVRAAAWREHAYALYYTGSFAEAERACEHGYDALDQCVVDEYDRARIEIVHSLVFRAMERFDEAAAIARRSAATFKRFDDLDRMASATLAAVQADSYRTNDYSNCIDELRRLETTLRDTTLVETHARVLGNIGAFSWRAGRFEEALTALQTVRAIMEDLGIETEVLRVRHSIALLLMNAGKTQEAETRLREIQTEYESRQMVGEAVLTGLELANLQLTREDYEGVAEICQRAIHAYESTGLAHTTKAMTALAYLREAAAHHRATPQLVHHVETYLRKLPKQPSLLFAPPAE
jgi:tetratricopeptide (TPR) repeat protein